MRPGFEKAVERFLDCGSKVNSFTAFRIMLTNQRSIDCLNRLRYHQLHMISGAFPKRLLQTGAIFLTTTAFANAFEKDPGGPPSEPSSPRVQSERSFALPTDDKPQSKFLKQIATDFRNVFTTRENLWILSAGLGASLLAKPADDDIPNSRFNSELFGGNGLDRLFEPGERIGGTLFQVGAAFTAFTIGKATSNSEVENLGRDLVRAQIVAQGLTQAIKHTVRRTRPDESSKTSFPSGHSSGTFATATVLQRRYGWNIGLPAYSLAGYVAASRLSENKHFLSDVIFGAAVGILASRTVTFGVGESRFAILPIVVSDGTGVQVSLLR